MIKKIFFGIIISTMLFSQSIVAAVDYDFYSSNDILFYDPTDTSCTSGGATNLVGNDNIEKILRFYVGKGLTLVQAAGIVGNYQQESGNNPAKIQGGGIADETYVLQPSVGFGLAQWTTDGRHKALQNYATYTNKSLIDLGMQLNFSWQELTTTYKKALANLKEATTPEDAAYVFHKYYEGSADSEQFVKEVRGGNAIEIFNSFKTIIADETSDVQNFGANCSGNGVASEYIDGFAIYNQYDPQWSKKPYGTSTIGEAGCGPSAMAMIITALTGKNVTPVDTANFGTKNNLFVEGQGSSWNITPEMSKNWGLSAVSINKDIAEINNALRNGGLIITSGKGSNPFSSVGHYIVIRGVTEDGKWMIGDSNGKLGLSNSEKEWDPNQIMVNMADGNVWVVTK